MSLYTDMMPAYTDVKTMHTDIVYHMRMSGRTRHLLSSRWAQDALANVLVRQQVLLHDPPASGVPVLHRNRLHALTSIFTA